MTRWLRALTSLPEGLAQLRMVAHNPVTPTLVPLALSSDLLSWQEHL